LNVDALRNRRESFSAAGAAAGLSSTSLVASAQGAYPAGRVPSLAGLRPPRGCGVDITHRAPRGSMAFRGLGQPS